MSELFADNISELTLTGPLVRIDLVSLSATAKDAEGKPKPELRQRIVMPVDGFVQSFSLMSQLMAQLEKQGVITRNAPGAAPAAPAAVAAPAGPAKSPNFS